MAIGVSFTGYDGSKKEAIIHSTSQLPSFMGDTISNRFVANRKLEQTKSLVDQDLLKKRDVVDGPLVGISGNDSPSPDGQSRAVGSMGGWRIPVSRTEMLVSPSLEMKCNKVTLVKLEYDLIISEKGYVKGRSEERRVWEKSFFVMAEGDTYVGSSSGEFLVKPFWYDDFELKPVLKKLAFGSSEDLNTYDESADDFACNHVDNDLDKDMKQNPPVKIVETATCEYSRTVE